MKSLKIIKISVFLLVITRKLARFSVMVTGKQFDKI